MRYDERRTLKRHWRPFSVACSSRCFLSSALRIPDISPCCIWSRMPLHCFADRRVDTLYRVSGRNRGTGKDWGSDARNAHAGEKVIYYPLHAFQPPTEAEEALIRFDEKFPSLSGVDRSNQI
jgi:hypothetical protein